MCLMNVRHCGVTPANATMLTYTTACLLKLGSAMIAGARVCHACLCYIMYQGLTFVTGCRLDAAIASDSLRAMQEGRFLQDSSQHNSCGCNSRCTACAGTRYRKIIGGDLMHGSKQGGDSEGNMSTTQYQPASCSGCRRCTAWGRADTGRSHSSRGFAAAPVHCGMISRVPTQPHSNNRVYFSTGWTKTGDRGARRTCVPSRSPLTCIFSA